MDQPNRCIELTGRDGAPPHFRPPSHKSRQQTQLRFERCRINTSSFTLLAKSSVTEFFARGSELLSSGLGGGSNLVALTPRRSHVWRRRPKSTRTSDPEARGSSIDRQSAADQKMIRMSSSSSLLTSSSLSKSSSSLTSTSSAGSHTPVQKTFECELSEPSALTIVASTFTW